MMNKYEEKIINKLLDKYENSKSFIGQNKVNQRFSVKIATVFPRYTDHSNFEIFQAVNEAVDVLVRKSMVRAKANLAHVYSNVILNIDNIEETYNYVGRVSKRDVNSTVLELLKRYKERNEIITRYCKAQIERISLNKSIQFFNDDVLELENILIAVDELLKVESETFVRDFSVKVFKDSKAFEKIVNKVISLIYEFGDFPEKEQVLGNLNIIKNPTYVNFKGSGSITIKGQKIDLSNLNSDIAISSIMLPDIEKIEVVGKAVITIENLTSFHTFYDKDMFVIYLGGYHNSIRREFIKKIYCQNSDIAFFHFGDIDAGGFYILEHLRQQTGVDFIPYKMNVDTIMKFSKYTKRLTENDRNRLMRLVDGEHGEVVRYMLENDCKLEQEAVDDLG